MASSTKIVYGTNRWALGAEDIPIENGSSISLAWGHDEFAGPRATAPITEDNHSAGVDVGYARNISIIFTSQDQDDYAFDAAIFGWTRTDEATPIYIPMMLAFATVHIGAATGVSGSTVLPDTSILAKELTLDVAHYQPSETAGNTLAYTDPDGVALTLNYIKMSIAVLKIELSWPVELINMYVYEGAGNHYVGGPVGFIYALA